MAIAELKDRIVFITGAASGIGAATARAFAEQGSRLILTDLDEAGLSATAAPLADTAPSVVCHQLDVTDAGAFQQLADNLRRDIGAPHVVINNAGIGGFGSFLNTPMEGIRRIMEVNLFGVINGCHTFLPMMIDAGDDRHLVNVASAASVVPMPNMSAYAASKYAVDGLTEVIAMELADTKVDVTCVHPGVINTPIVQGKSWNGDEGRTQERKLSEHYEAHGSDPAVVGNDIVKAVQKGHAHLFTGAKAMQGSIMKRVSPSLTRTFSRRIAHSIGYA